MTQSTASSSRNAQLSQLDLVVLYVDYWNLKLVTCEIIWWGTCVDDGARRSPTVLLMFHMNLCKDWLLQCQIYDYERGTYLNWIQLTCENLCWGTCVDEGAQRLPTILASPSLSSCQLHVFPSKILPNLHCLLPKHYCLPHFHHCHH